MTHPRLHNYLRVHRKKSGLSQHEVATIIGCRNGGVVSRYEWSRRLPPLRIALALEILFRAPVAQLFSGVCEAVERETTDQLEKLESRLQDMPGKGSKAAVTAKKLVWLTERKNGLSEL